MVEHDETRMSIWVQERELKRENEPRALALHWSVLAVQSVACCVMILVIMLLRVAGGEAYRSLQQSFYRALEKNEWVSALSLLMDGNLWESENELDIRTEDCTDGSSAQMTDLSTAVIALKPLTEGALTSHYGERIHPIDGTSEFHTGVDVAAPMGSSLMAVY